MIRSACLVFLFFLAGGNTLKAQEWGQRCLGEIWPQYKLRTSFDAKKEADERETGVLQRLFGDTPLFGFGRALITSYDASKFQISFPGYLMIDASEKRSAMALGAFNVLADSARNGRGIMPLFGAAGHPHERLPVGVIRNGWRVFGDGDWRRADDADSPEPIPSRPRGDFDFRGLPGAPAGDFEFRADLKI
jgi:hypothetical protein